jgi:hypothetical protein
MARAYMRLRKADLTKLAQQPGEHGDGDGLALQVTTPGVAS